MVRTSGAAAWRTSQVNDEEDAAAIRDGARGLADARRLATLATRAGYEGNPPQRAEEQNAIVSECLHAPTTACTRSRYARAIVNLVSAVRARPDRVQPLPRRPRWQKPTHPALYTVTPCEEEC